MDSLEPVKLLAYTIQPANTRQIRLNRNDAKAWKFASLVFSKIGGIVWKFHKAVLTLCYSGPIMILCFDPAMVLGECYNDERKLEIQNRVIEMSPLSDHFYFSIEAENMTFDETYPAEIMANLDVINNLRLDSENRFLGMEVLIDNSNTTLNEQGGEAYSSRSPVYLSSFLLLPLDLELNAALSYVGNQSNLDIFSSVQCDVRLGWQVIKEVELSLIAQNIFDQKYRELGDSVDRSITPELERGYYAKLAWRF